MTSPASAVPEPYYAPGWPTAPQRRLDGLAVAAFVTSVVGIGLVGIGLGLAALRRIRRGTTTGRGLALAGVAIGTVWTVVEVVAVVSLVNAAAAARPLPFPVEEAQVVPVTRLVTGHCLRGLPDDGQVHRVEVVPCDADHAAQVISEFRFAPDAVWPGQEAANARVAIGCELSDPEQEAGVEVVTWAPTERSWDDGDRSGLCVAHRNGGLTGSLLDGTADLG